MNAMTPMKWRVSTLGKCCRIVSGGTPKREMPEYWDGDIPWATPKDISSLDEPDFYGPLETISELGLKHSSAALLPAGAVLMSSRAPIGLLAIAGRPMATNQGFKSLVAGPELDNRFLYYAIRRIVPEIQERGSGATFKEVSKSVVSEIPISYPASVDEQKRIAAILDKSDAVRRKRERVVAMTDELLRAAFLQMFGDPVLNTKQMPTVALGDLIKVSSGNGLTAKNMHPNGRYPVYGGNGVNGFHSEYMFEEPQIVIGRVGVYCGAVHMSEPKSWVTDNALYVREYKRPVNRTYLEWALRFANLNQYAGRAAQPLISGSRIYPVEILLPNEDRQNAFAAFVFRQKALKANLNGARDEAEALFNSLYQRAFRGEL
ncbi:MAG: restriction endonuclease subunit S [Rhodobacteraceae bacterium]|jgi:type I restriction enzyme S subunit|nr:restriction endonuclease subunit S [Paracoccaceae bacterium]